MKSITRVIQSPDVLDSYSATQFLKEIETVIEAGVHTIVIDLKHLTFMSSSGLMALVSAFKSVRDASGRLFVCSMNEQVRMLFEITGVDQVFETFTSLDEFHRAHRVPAKATVLSKSLGAPVAKSASVAASTVLA
jgi:anti-sigma B factor antagonist